MQTEKEQEVRPDNGNEVLLEWKERFAFAFTPGDIQKDEREFVSGFCHICSNWYCIVVVKKDCMKQIYRYVWVSVEVLSR